MTEYDDLFGSVMPENLPPVTSRGGYGHFRGRGPSNKATKSRDHYKRTREHLQKLKGGMFWPCDRKEILFSGAMVTVDLLGFMDIQGLTAEGKLVGCNVTTKDSVGAHMRKYTDPNNTYSAAKWKVPELLRAFLNFGGEFCIVYWEKGKKEWEPTLLWVTPELMDLYVARKRSRVA